MYNEIPFDIKTKFNLPNIDKGIDLLLMNNDDEFYPIQCKFRSNVNEIIYWNELATFAGLLFVGSFKKGILITNTFDICDEIS